MGHCPTDDTGYLTGLSLGQGGARGRGMTTMSPGDE